VEGLLRSDITSRYQAYEIAIRNKWMSPDEVRQKENLGPMPVMPEEPSDTPSPNEIEGIAGDSVEDVGEQETDAPEAVS
jgi:hypothetical protein